MNKIRRFLSSPVTFRLTSESRIFDLQSNTQQIFVKTRLLIRDLIFGNVKYTKKPSFPGNIAGKTSRRLSVNSQLLSSTSDSLNSSIVSKLVSRWVSNSIAADLRRNAAKQLLLRGSGLSLGLIGVCVNLKGPSLITDVDEVEAKCQQVRSVFSTLLANFLSKSQQPNSSLFSLENLRLGECIAKGCNAVVYEGKLAEEKDYNYAVKMMFNYDIESNSAAIWNSMNKECLTFNGNFSSNEELHSILTRRNKMKSHPNIIEIYGVFVDKIPSLPNATNLYPSALPPRIYDQGYGRNMTLFLVMKKFDMSLKEFLNEEKLSTQTSLLLLYQLFEAVSHLVKQKVSHRDIKTDNILVDISKGIEYPWLTLTDFGTCCTSLRLPFTSHDVCRGGNLALMAPEVVTAEPGPFASIDYSMADLWSSATIAYEIFNGKNPFYPQQGYKCLQSSRYDENQLPDLPKTAPKPISLLIKNILRRNPSCRPNPKECASMCAMLLFCSKRCLQSLQTISHCSDSIKSQKLLQWLRTLSATTFCQRNTILGGKRLNAVEIKARLMFLSDVKIENLLPNFKYL